jgi:hypothetical protein
MKYEIGEKIVVGIVVIFVLMLAAGIVQVLGGFVHAVGVVGLVLVSITCWSIFFGKG